MFLSPIARITLRNSLNEYAAAMSDFEYKQFEQAFHDNDGSLDCCLHEHAVVPLKYGI
jgi:hypothetical protein